jgi:precorrin-6A/cobalt-precorrin-6A reductase
VDFAAPSAAAAPASETTPPVPGARHVLILGGTTEARRLAGLLAAPASRDAAHNLPPLLVTTSLAGRVAQPAPLPGAVRVGGFGGADGLARWLRTHHVDALIDATHPFADTISSNAARAADDAHVPLLVLRRPGWEPSEGDDWHSVGSLAEAAEALPALGERVFLTTGRTGLAAFAHLDGLWFLLRCVDPPRPPLPARLETLLARGPFTLDDEREVLRGHRVDVVVSKDSGGAATAPKLTAAREAGLPVVLVRRPAPVRGTQVVEEPEQAVAWVRSHLG